MIELKVGKSSDRTPVKLTIVAAPELAAALGNYAALYRKTYAQEEPVAELIPAMVRAFLVSDRVFAKARTSATTK